MDVALKLTLALVIVSVADWLFFTRIGSFFADFDYRYWPLSKSRLFSLLVIMGLVGSMFLFVKPNPDNPSMWVLIPFGVALIAHLFVGYRDLFSQRRSGYRSPPRYVDTDEY